MTKAQKLELCDECRLEGGWHWTDEDVPKGHRPHHESAKRHAEAVAITALAHEEAMRAARKIIADAALRYREFSGNDVRAEMDAAGVPKACIGAAFTAVGNAKNSPIRHTGRHEMSSEGHVRHRIGIWESTVYGRGAA